MKAVFVLFAVVLAVASVESSGIHAYGLGLASPLVSPLAYSAPLAVAPVAVAPAVQSGYVAATRGAVHTAPLPQGPFAFSHHINTAPAPGTF